MKTLININIIVFFLLLAANVNSQTCQNESDIPSTTPDSRFTDNDNGTISDNGTGLMWQKCQLGLSGSSCLNGNGTIHTWQQALDEADINTLAEYSDWRLPNHNELLSIIEQRCYTPSINTNYFPNTSSSFFWSASPVTRKPAYAWYVYFVNGQSYYDTRDDHFYVRLVRL